MQKPIDAAFAIIHDGNNMLVVVRKDGRLGIPGGKLELGESPVEAVARELSEEIGYHTSFSSDSFIGTYDHPVDGRKIHVFELDVGVGHFANILGCAMETVYLGSELHSVGHRSMVDVASMQGVLPSHIDNDVYMETLCDSVVDLLKKKGIVLKSVI